MIRLRDVHTKDLVYLAKNLIETVRILCLKDAIFVPANKSPYKPEKPYIVRANKTLEVEEQFATEADAIEYIATNILNNEK